MYTNKTNWSEKFPNETLKSILSLKDRNELWIRSSGIYLKNKNKIVFSFLHRHVISLLQCNRMYPLFREVTIWELQVIRKDSNSEPNLHCPQTKPKRSCKMLTQVRLYASCVLVVLRCGDFGTFNLGQTENSFPQDPWTGGHRTWESLLQRSSIRIDLFG